MLGWKKTLDQATDDFGRRADAMQDQLSEVAWLITAALITCAVLSVLAVAVAVSHDR